jgi:hypothetical protein
MQADLRETLFGSYPEDIRLYRYPKCQGQLRYVKSKLVNNNHKSGKEPIRWKSPCHRQT